MEFSLNQIKTLSRRVTYLDPQRLYSSAPQLRKTRLLLGRHPVLPFSPRTRTTLIPLTCLKHHSLLSNLHHLGSSRARVKRTESPGISMVTHHYIPAFHSDLDLSWKNTCLVPHCREELRSRCLRLSPLAGCSPQ